MKQGADTGRAASHQGGSGLEEVAISCSGAAGDTICHVHHYLALLPLGAPDKCFERVPAGRPAEQFLRPPRPHFGAYDAKAEGAVLFWVWPAVMLTPGRQGQVTLLHSILQGENASDIPQHECISSALVLADYTKFIFTTKYLYTVVTGLQHRPHVVRHRKRSFRFALHLVHSDSVSKLDQM